MLQKLLILVVLALCLGYSNIFGQSNIIVGKIIDSSTEQVISNAHIINISNGNGAISNEKGLFKIKAFIFDTLYVSSLSYNKHYFFINIDADTIEIRLDKKIYEIPEVDVYKFKNYNDFKFAVLTLPKESLMVDEIPWFKEYLAVSKSEFVNVVSFSPITMLYNRYSKTGQDVRMYARRLETDRFQASINSRYNHEIVSKLTGITNEEEILKFIEFCALPSAFILNVSDYDLYLAIINCFSEYSK